MLVNPFDQSLLARHSWWRLLGFTVEATVVLLTNPSSGDSLVLLLRRMEGSAFEILMAEG